MKRLISIIIIIFLIFTNITFVSAEDNTPFSYVVIDRSTGDVLLEKNADETIYPASTTKILTAIVALENAGLSSYMTTSKVASGELEAGAVRLGLLPNEKMQFYDLLHALLLKSANDVAIVIAENIADSVEGFAEMSNEFAKSIGAVNTHFTNPHGLHDSEHYTTAYDLAVITSYALKNYAFSSVVSKTDYTLNATDDHVTFPRLVNSNPILGKNDGYDFLITGVKTGYTSKAKYVLVSSARNYDGREVVCVVTGCETRLLSSQYSLKLINEAFNNFSIQSIVKPGDIVTDYLAGSESIPLASSKQVDYLLPKDSQKWQISKNIDLYYDNVSIIEKGDILGELTYTYEDKQIGQSYLVATEEFLPSGIVKEHDVQLTDESLIDKSDHYIWFIISVIWVIMLIVLFYILYIKKPTEQRSRQND
ncbi:MAG: D-alanyl-D-alanine carboxypeptidase [Clostridia bacterium]|nr:D-alanyl-D-alanine carboxypeptidase [Clostridia bacterium]